MSAKVASGDEQGKDLVAEDEADAGAVARDDVLEELFGFAVEDALLRLRRVAEELGGHHGGEGERDDGRDEDGDGERDGELAEEAADDIAHEEQGDEHGDERDGEREDGEADLLGALERGVERRVAFFEVARDVLDHDDGVVDDEAGRNGEGHQAKIVEAVAEQIHDAEGADDRKRDGDGGDDGRLPGTQEEEDDHDDESDGEHELELDVFDAGADGVGAVGEDFELDARGQRGAQLREQPGDFVDDADDVGAGLPLDVEDDAGVEDFVGGR